MTYFGKKGYLATITSKEENNFINSLISKSGWLGGTCHNSYVVDKNDNIIYNTISESLGNWYWVTGPEKGQQFRSKTSGNIMYTNWNSGEPNNYNGTERFLHAHGNGTWNDYANNNSNIKGYIVEYGGLDDDEFDLSELAYDTAELK